MKRKVWFISLAALLVISLVFVAVGCGSGGEELKAEFRSGVSAQSYVSKDIDLDDYIVKVDGAEHNVTVEYYNLISGKTVSENFYGNNMVFYPKMIGEHTLIYTVKKDRAEKTATMVISVISDPPTITISHTAQTISMPEENRVTRSYEYLMSNASMILTPLTATTEITAVSYRSVSVGLDSEEAQWVDIEVEEGAETFTFTEIGEYRFNVKATSEDNSSEDYFLVNVIKDPSGGTQKTDGTKVIETGKGVVYDEDDPYTFKIMSSTLSDINYAVVADKLGDGKKLSLVFKGQNVPQLGFYVVPDEGSDIKYNLKTTQGGFFSFVAKESSGHKWVFFFPNMLTGNAARTPVPGTNDFGIEDLDSDKYYLMQYSLGAINFNESINSQQLKVNVEIFEALSYTTKDEKSVCVAGEKLYEIGAEGAFWYERGSGKKFDFTKGSTVIYGDIRNNIDIQYIADESNILQAPKEELLVAGTNNVYSYKSTVTENGDGSLSASLQQGKISDDAVNGITDQLGYVGVTDSGFGMGTTITLDFIGKNLPGIGIYLDNSPENYAIGGATASGTGLYIGNGNVSGELSSIGRRLIVNGPNRLDPGGTYRGNSDYPPYFGRIDGLSYLGSDDTNKSAEMGYDLLEDGKKYRFEISDVSHEADSEEFSKLSLRYRLYDVSAATPVTLADVTKTVSRDYPEINFKSQTIAFFGSIHHDVSFTYSISGERTEYPFENQTVPGAITLHAAKITEVQDENRNAIGFGGTYDYQGMGRYNVGDVLEFTFIGKNIPNVGLFTNANGVNAVGGGKANTGLFLQTSGYGVSTYDTRLYVTGPYLIDAGSAEYYDDILGTVGYRGWLGANKELAVDISNTGDTSLFGIDMLDGRTKYVYKVWTAAVANDPDKVTINTALYTVDADGARTSVAQFSCTVTHYLDSLENRYATVYGTGGYINRDISFAYAVNPG